MQTASVLYRPQYTQSERKSALAHLARINRMVVPFVMPVAQFDTTKLGLETPELWALSLPIPYHMQIDAPPPRQPCVSDIQRAVAVHYGVTRAEILSIRHPKKIVMPRQVAVFICRQLTGHSYPDLGRRFGNRHHATLIYAYQKIDELIQTSPSVAADVKSITETVLSGRCAR